MKWGGGALPSREGFAPPGGGKKRQDQLGEKKRASSSMIHTGKDEESSHVNTDRRGQLGMRRKKR